MSSNNTARGQSQGQATSATSQKKPSGMRPIMVPLTSYENYEQLDNPHLRDICKHNWDVQTRCIMCEHTSDGFIVCKTCKATDLYCSWECQVDDQPHHALFCKEWSKFEHPPAASQFRILVFPALSSTPLLAWGQVIFRSREANPSIVFRHPEFASFARVVFHDADGHKKLARMGCLNESRALAARKSSPGLGHGLLVLEFIPPAGTKLSMDWINKSIPAVTAGLSPGQGWLWTGPIAVVAVDLSLTSPKENKFALEHINRRDVRHAIDFFTLNMRNAVVPTPSPSLASPTRFPLPTVPAIKLTEIHTPVARTLHITSRLQQVRVSRDVAPTGVKAYQGLPVVCSALGLAWVVRVVLCHGPELDWLYDGFYTHPVPSGASVVANGGDEGGGLEMSVIPSGFCFVFAVDPITNAVEQKMLPRSGDGLVVMHAGGGELREEHVRAVLSYLEEKKMDWNEGRVAIEGEGWRKDFKLFWENFKAEEKLAADFPSPYDLKPRLYGIQQGQKFVVCKELFKEVVPKLARGMRLTANGTCTRY
ncbi:hypothetical protein C8A01DRAFT_34080 [Parachaetomium inaequale]|uniref:Uncharacterized protein n=1 Tax=Parachaetomium inaequale TaxID=2588326 RepID=A0AAN6STU7_9PEZI|nr:hypothetical protein C8A01DRAFT_34080 [Parachaetomium inaequale]